MRAGFLVAAAAIALAGCGGGGKAAMVNACVKDGQDKKTCDCTVNELAKNMDKETFAALSKAATTEGGMGSGAMELTMQQQGAAIGAMMGAAMKCGMN